MAVDRSASIDLIVIQGAPIEITTFQLEGGTDRASYACTLGNFRDVLVTHILVGLPRLDGLVMISLGVPDHGSSGYSIIALTSSSVYYLLP